MVFSRVGQPHRSTCGFTLIELLVVIAVITILAALVMPSMMQAVSMSERVRCGSNLAQINRGMMIYANQFNKFFPANKPCATGCGTDNMAPLFVGKYVPDIKTFACPATEDNPEVADDLKHKPTEGGKMSYEYWGEYNPGLRFPGANTTVLVVAHDEEGYGVNVYIDKDNHGNSGMNIMFLDGHVEWVTARRWYPGPDTVYAATHKEWARVRR